MRACIRALCLPPLAVAVAVGAARAYEDGAPPAHTGGFGEASCHECHSDNPLDDERGHLSIAGLPARYQPQRRYALTLSLSHPDLASGGFQLSVRGADGRTAGTLTSDSPRVERVAADAVDYLQHTHAGRKPSEAGRISWSFEWQAPAQGENLALHIAANAANDDQSALGDFIYLLERCIEVRAD